MITRSTGISPGVPWAGPLPGGGYEGKTKRLDRAVAHFADWLERHFDGPVEIRFNSDRLSGGAYVYPDGKVGFGLPEIGLGAGLIIPEHVKQERDRAWETDEWRRLPALEWLDCWTEETPLDYKVLVYAKYLRDPSDLGRYRTGEKSGFWHTKTPQQAYRLVQKLVKQSVMKG